MTTIRVVLVANHLDARSSLAVRLNLEDDLQVIGALSCDPTAVAQARELNPDVILLDIGARNGTGLPICRALSGDPRPLPVIVLVAYPDQRVRRQALAAGARAYMVKEIDSAGLVAKIRAVALASRKSG